MSKIHGYFDRASKEWNIRDFLEECELEPFEQKIDCYVKSLQAIANSKNDDRSKTAQQLLDNFRKKASIRFWSFYGDGSDRQVAKSWNNERSRNRIYIQQPIITGENINGFINMNKNGTFVSGSSISKRDHEEPVHQNLLQSHDPKGLQENDDKIASLIESMKKISISVNAKELGLEIDKISPRINDMIVIDLARQVLYKEIRISLRELLKIVKPEVRQDMINSIANPDITKKCKIPCGGKRRCKVNKTFLNDSSSLSSIGSSSETDSGSNNEMATYVIRTKKSD
ncbi:16529_t:CDS:2 [Dentiscutata heterogama]|uniref:16529_t:CDS:1 n=1 Tax=Dentiscutata heterogama TaxID=1316150 RepID=A0ACA9LBX8_9GLOM|nr:16529_t:CDS:2 [Dentiscutata heterogama]